MGVEEVIDPRETRAYLVQFVNNAYRVLPHHLGPKTRFAGRP
jgi:hypothetical protein